MTLAVTLLLAAASLAVSLRGGSFVPDAAGPAAPAFELLGHRGARGLMPENTLPAFGQALAIGVTTLELDVVLTADGVPVVLHDRRLPAERTRDSAGAWLKEEGPPVRSLTLAQLGRYDVGCLRPGSRAAEAFPGQACLQGVAVPSLAEVLALGETTSGRRIRYSIETKSSPGDSEGFAGPETLAAAVVEAIRWAGVEERASIQSFDWRSLVAVRERAPEIATVHLTAERPWLDNLQRGRPGASPWLAGFDADDFPARTPDLVAAAGGAVWSPFYRDLRSGEIAAAQALGLRVVVWTVNEPLDMARLLDEGVDGIVTDYPDRLRQVLVDRQRALPPAFAPRN